MAVLLAFLICYAGYRFMLNEDLWQAVQPGDEQRVRMLLRQGADPHYEGEFGETLDSYATPGIANALKEARDAK